MLRPGRGVAGRPRHCGHAGPKGRRTWAGPLTGCGTAPFRCYRHRPPLDGAPASGAAQFPQPAPVTSGPRGYLLLHDTGWGRGNARVTGTRLFSRALLRWPGAGTCAPAQDWPASVRVMRTMFRPTISVALVHPAIFRALESVWMPMT